MNILLAFDKFKDAAGAAELCQAGLSALQDANFPAEVKTLPLTDGGEGFATLLTSAVGGSLRYLKVHGPRGKLQTAVWGLVEGQGIPVAARAFIGDDFAGRLGIVEMAQAAGLEQVPPKERDPFKTTTYGVGEILREVFQEADLVLLGLGGSATNDLGVGALAALGLEVVEAAPDAAVPSWVYPQNWPSDSDRLRWRAGAKYPPLIAACDVDNPLFGPRGATRGFGPQKGLANEEALAAMEEKAQRLATLLEGLSGADVAGREEPGSGAAGGISWGLGNFLSLRRVSGSAFVAAWQEWERLTDWADIVITGEGCVDEGFFSGKGPGAIARMAVAKGVKVKVLAGKIETGALEQTMGAPGQVEFIGLNPPGEPLSESLPQTLPRLQKVLSRCLVP